MNKVGTISIGVKCPIIKEGYKLDSIVCDSVMEAVESLNMTIEDKDIIAVTESVVARADGNYCTVDDIATDIKNKFGENATVSVIFPILSRNRFSILLKGIARGAKRIILMLSFPRDEVGNELIEQDKFEKCNIPLDRVMGLNTYRELFGENKHPFTGVDYVDYYQKLIESENCDCEIVFSNDPTDIVFYTTGNILTCDIHTRNRTKNRLKAKKLKNVYTLSDIMNESVNGSGFNSKYGLLGSNKSTEEKVKLFPNDPSTLVTDIKTMIKERTNKDVEVMVYGDGAFKDPVGKIWELADPCVSPAYTDGLVGTPNELKLKYLADNKYADLTGEELDKAIQESIKNKDSNLKGTMATQGTTPRQITDLLGSLADLTSGSGDKGTPIVLIKNYFNNYKD